MIRKVNRIQAFWRKRKFRKENLYMTKFAIEILALNASIDAIIEKLKPHYDELIEKLQVICRRVRQKSIVAVYGSYGNGLFVPSSDIDLVVSFRTYDNIAPPFFGDLSFRQAVPRSVSNVGNTYHHKSKTTTTTGTSESVTFGKIWQLPSSAQRSPGSVTVMEELVRELAQSQGNLVRSITFVRNCRIPVIKVVATSSEDVTCHIDITESTANHGGLRASSLVKDLISKNPSIRPLIVVVKQFLKERKLMKVQHNDGGMSSYALFVLMVTYLKHVKCLNKPTKQGYHLLGRLLLNFFVCTARRQTLKPLVSRCKMDFIV